MGYDRVTMAAVEALAGRPGIGSRVSEGLRTVFPKRREVPTYSAEAVMDALGPHVNPNSRFAQEMTDFRQGPPPDLSDLAKGTLVRVGIGVGIATAVSLVAGCAPHIFPDGGAAPTDGSGATPTPPVDPNPAYTGPADHCWTLYDQALHGTDASHPMPSADAQDLVDCGNQNPGYFEQHEIPVVDPQGNTATVIYGDRPPH